MPNGAVTTVAKMSGPPLSRTAQLPCLAPHLFFRDKLHLPENMTVQPEECQNSVLLSVSYFGQAACFRTGTENRFQYVEGVQSRSGWLFTKFGRGTSRHVHEMRDIKF